MIDLLKQLWCRLFGHRRSECFWVRDDAGAVRLDFCPRCETILDGEVEVDAYFVTDKVNQRF